MLTNENKNSSEIYSLIGKMLREHNSEEYFNRIVKLLEQPEVMNKNNYAIDYLFRKAGLGVMFDVSTNSFLSAFMHLRTGMVRSGVISPYRCELPCEIFVDDNRFEVQRKIGLEPESTTQVPGPSPDAPRDLCDVYKFDGMQLRFLFDGAQGELVSVSCRRQLEPKNTSPFVSI